MIPLPSRWLRIAAILPIALLLGRTVAAEEALDPPDRVARISYVQGDVSTAPAEGGERERAELNRPLTTGDELAVGDGARAELQVDVASLQLGERSSISLLTLDDQTLQLRLIEGEMIVHVRELRDTDHIEIETANTRVSLLRPGEYRVSVEQGGEATVVGVREGGTEIQSGSQVFSLHASQEARYTGTTTLEEEVRSLGPRTELETWADRRETPLESSQSARYVSREVIGYDDLDRYGVWESDHSYGPVWYPRRISAGWAPYRFGQWAYIGPWGWTWIDQAPWGFAPFHYGRWAYLRSRWCWVPGPRHVRPVYAPALVGWVGRGSGYAWFPLGPREVYVPRHRASDRYVRQVNVSNTNINVNHITNIYRNRVPPGRFVNQRAADGVTAIPRETFTAGRPGVRYVGRGGSRDGNAVRPTYQPPALAPSSGRQTRENREWRAGTANGNGNGNGNGNVSNGSSNPPATPVRESSRPPSSRPPTRSEWPARDLSNRDRPVGEIPRGNIPGTAVPSTRPIVVPPVRSQSVPSYRNTPLPSRSVTSQPTRSEPPPRSSSPPARTVEREIRSQPMPERRYSPPPPPQPQSQNNRFQRPDRREK